MFKYGFKEANDFMAVCKDASDTVNKSCITCQRAVNSMVGNGFSGEAATLSEKSFLQWYAKASKTAVSFGLLYTSLKEINTEAQLLKRSSELIAASIDAPHDNRCSWTSSEVAAEGNAVNLSASVQSLMDIEINTMQGNLRSMGEELAEISCGKAVSVAIEEMKTNFINQKVKLNELKSTTTTFVEGISAFESKNALSISELGFAIGQSGSGVDLVNCELNFYDISKELAKNGLDVAEGAADIVSAGCFAKAGIHGKPKALKSVSYQVMPNGRVVWHNVGNNVKGLGRHLHIKDLKNLPKAASAAKGISAAKYAKGLGWAGGALSVGFGWFKGYNEEPNATESKKLINANVEAGIDFGGVLASAAAGAAAGAIVGTAFPIIGNAGCAAFGFGVGLVVGFGYGFVDEEVIHGEGDDGKSAADKWKDSLYEDFGLEKNGIHTPGYMYPGASMYGV